MGAVSFLSRMDSLEIPAREYFAGGRRGERCELYKNCWLNNIDGLNRISIRLRLFLCSGVQQCGPLTRLGLVKAKKARRLPATASCNFPALERFL